MDLDTLRFFAGFFGGIAVIGLIIYGLLYLIKDTDSYYGDGHTHQPGSGPGTIYKK